MEQTQPIQEFLTVMVREGIYSSAGNLLYNLQTLFKGVDLKGKNVLDIGGGRGLYSFWASVAGARKVVCLEPELEGSSAAVIAKFRELKTILKLDNVELKKQTFQQFDPGVEKFDIILSHYSINHLNEEATVTLLKDESSRAIYRNLFLKFYSIQPEGGKLILCDCSRYNLFAMLKIRNPFNPSIEWEKHQSPDTWAKLLKDAGYRNPEISWETFNRLGNTGKALLGNRFMSYFFLSTFRLIMMRP